MPLPAVQRLLRARHVTLEEFTARLKGFVDEEFERRRIKLGEERRGK
jgi:hypothetical protein